MTLDPLASDGEPVEFAAVEAEDAAEIAADDLQLAELIASIRAGDNGRVSQLLTRRPELSRARDVDGKAPLHIAAEVNEPRSGLLLLDAGAEANARFGLTGHTALSWAVTCRSLEFARTLVRLAHAPDLFCSAGIGSIEHVTSWFDRHGRILPLASRTGSTRFNSYGHLLPCPPLTAREVISDALYIACRNGHPKVVEFLLQKNPELSFRAFLGGTLLHWAYFGGSTVIVEMLLKAGVDETVRDDMFQCRPRAFGICVLASWGLTDFVRERLEADPSLAVVDDGGTTPLHEAAGEGHTEVVRLLLEAGAPFETKDARGQTPLDLANTHGHDAVARLLRNYLDNSDQLTIDDE